MTSLGKNCYVGTLNYKKLVPAVTLSALEKTFVADTNIAEGKVVQLKTNGKIEEISGTETIAPAFPVQPYQQFGGTGTSPGPHTEVLYTSQTQVIISYEDTSARQVALRYADIDKNSTTPFTFKTPVVVYQAPGSNTITYNRSILDADFRDPATARGITLYAEAGTGASVGTYIVCWIYTYASNTIQVGTPVQVSPNVLDFDATFIPGAGFTNQLWIITGNNLLQLALLDFSALTSTLQTPTQVVDGSLVNLTNPRITPIEGNQGLYVMCFYSNGGVPKGRSIQIDSFPTFTLGAIATNTISGNLYAVTKKQPGLDIWVLCNQSSPGVGFTTWSFDESTATFSISTSVNLSSGNPIDIEYLNVAGVNYLVWFSEGYISNLPFAGYYNLDISNNTGFTLTPSAPADFGSIGVIDQDLDMVYAWSGTGDGRVALCNLGDRTTNLDAQKIIGVSTETKVTGEEVKVELLGSVSKVTTASALEPTGEVYVDFEGDISQRPVIGEVVIGKALTTNEALLHTNLQVL